MQSEADIQKAIVEALVWDGWLILRINQGGRHVPVDVLGGTGPRYVRFAYWQALGIDQQDSGISDVIALKTYKDTLFPGTLLAIEVKATGKAKKLHAAVMDDILREGGPTFQKLVKREQGQALFLWSIIDHGGIAIVADSLEDILPYLERVEAQ